MITEQQRIERKKYIGSSDIAALFTGPDGKSLDPFKTAADVWASKVFDIKDKDSTEAQSRGNRHERAMIQFVAEKTGTKIEDNPEHLRFVCEEYPMFAVCEKHPIFAANLDGYTLTETPIIVEVKTTSMGDEYGEPETDQVPFRVNLQVHHQMLCTGWNKAYVATLRALFGRLDESLYIVNRDERIIEAIVKRGMDFWNNHVLAKTPPPDSQPGDIELYKRIIRTPSKYASVETDLIAEWENAKKTASDAGKEKDRLQAEILLQLGDAEGAPINSETELTYFEQNAADKVNLSRLKAEWPEIYAQIATPNKCRVMRIRKLKGK